MIKWPIPFCSLSISANAMLPLMLLNETAGLPTLLCTRHYPIGSEIQGTRSPWTLTLCLTTTVRRIHVNFCTDGTLYQISDKCTDSQQNHVENWINAIL